MGVGIELHPPCLGDYVIIVLPGLIGLSTLEIEFRVLTPCRWCRKSVTSTRAMPKSDSHVYLVYYILLIILTHHGPCKSDRIGIIHILLLVVS